MLFQSLSKPNLLGVLIFLLERVVVPGTGPGMEEFWADRKASLFSFRTGGWCFEVSGWSGKGPPAEYFTPLGFGLSCCLFNFFWQLHCCQCRGIRNVALVFWLLPLRFLCLRADVSYFVLFEIRDIKTIAWWQITLVLELHVVGCTLLFAGSQIR